MLLAMDPRIPADVYCGREYTAVHAAVLFADLENSVLISSTLLRDVYDELLDGFQSTMTKLIAELRAEGMPIGEAYVQGDQLSLFFYSADEVERNWLLDGPEALQGPEREALIQECRLRNDELVFKALQAAISLKNSWLVEKFNFDRVMSGQEPWGLGIGIHCGSVYLRDRPDGLRRIEGYAVNLAKRVEGASRMGRYSHVMLSQEACNAIRGSIRGHTQLRQRIFFHEHDFNIEVFKGVIRQQPVYELKFYHRIGVRPDAHAIGVYDSIFMVDPANSWAYYQLVDHYAFAVKDWERVFGLASRAYLIYPDDEKVLLDLAKYYMERKIYGLAIEYCEHALRVNSEFDLVYELLAVIYNELKDYETGASYLRKAVHLSPVSAVNHLNLGMILMHCGKPEEGALHMRTAIQLHPKYLEHEEVQETLLKMGLGAEYGLAAQELPAES